MTLVYLVLIVIGYLTIGFLTALLTQIILHKVAPDQQISSVEETLLVLTAWPMVWVLAIYWFIFYPLGKLILFLGQRVTHRGHS